MAATRANPRLQVGSAPWISTERASTFQVVESEAEEFTFSARNEMDWLNEHMAEIFSENQVNVAEIFKTPGKLRGKTPRTARKANPLGGRAPLSDVFSTTPRAQPSPFRQANYDKPVSTFQVAEDDPKSPDQPVINAKQNAEHRSPAPKYAADSGYFGSQWTEATQPNEPIDVEYTPKAKSPVAAFRAIPPPAVENNALASRESDRRTASFQSAREEQMRTLSDETVAKPESPKPAPQREAPQPSAIESPRQELPQKITSPHKQSPERPVAVVEPPVTVMHADNIVAAREDEPADEPQSASEGSSPIRPVVRKSSLNFASLPAREPITTKKSIGRRVSRTSHLDQPRTSYYGRPTGGKSLGNLKQDPLQSLADDDMELDEAEQTDRDDGSQLLRLHNKTSTQRLQDQISMLGKSQTSTWPPSKPVPNPASAQSSVGQSESAALPSEVPRQRSPGPKSPQRRPFATPGAFPEDEDDSWIGAPTAGTTARSVFSPRPQLAKSHSTDIMEDIREKTSIGGDQFKIPKRGETPRQMSPFREPMIPDRTTSTLGHMKSASTSVLRSPQKDAESSEPPKLVSVSNPNPTIDPIISTSPKSPARSQRGSPLKAAKDKFSSILKSSRGLFASSAAVSAEAKTAAMSPATSRMGLNPQPSFEDVLRNSQVYHNPEKQSILHAPYSPGKASTRTAPEFIIRENKREEEAAREAREAKEAQKRSEQLEKARQKVKEEARVYHLEQEKVAAMQKEAIARKEEEKVSKASQPASSPRATRSSPRKTKTQPESSGAKQTLSKDVEMSEAPALAAPVPAAQDIPRPKSQIGRPATKRPLKPAKEPVAKAKPPTVIRVDTGSQRGHQYHPSNANLAANLHETLAAPAAGPSQALKNKPSTSSIQKKASTNSFRNAAARALEAATKKKEQEELAAQRKRETERQRAAAREEDQRVEQQQRGEASIDKTAAARQAIEKRRLEVEKAKLTGAPPPAIRPQANMDLTIDMVEDKAAPKQRGDAVQAQSTRTQSTAYRPNEDLARSTNSTLHTSKAHPKRPLPQDTTDDNHSRPAAQRNDQNSHQAKRRRTSEMADDRNDNPEPRPKMTAPPIRQSNIRQKDVPSKSIFPNGYTNAQQQSNLQRTAVMSQHNQSKPTHPLDMAQISKAPIPFATNPGQGNAQTHKTPARPGQAPQGTKGKSAVKSAAKSAAKSSPRYQNGDSIELPEINTDSEDDDSDAGNDFVALSWTNSPDLRKQLAKQEMVDPAEVFGQPGPLVMEEVFSKSKDRFHKFRARTSSANWSGTDRLTEEEVRRDLEARDRVRRQGGWTYDSMV